MRFLPETLPPGQAKKTSFVRFFAFVSNLPGSPEGETSGEPDLSSVTNPFLFDR
jgi:hypothetical protein